MAKGKGVGIHKGTMGEHLLSGYGPLGSVNRPVRTRMQGGCGGWGRKTPGYPIICQMFSLI